MNEQALLEQYEGMIGQIARHFLNTLPTRMDLSDLCQTGRLALIEAARRFDPDGGMNLDAWLRIRVRGAIIDRMHKSTGASRTALRHYRRQKAMLEAQESAFDIAPDDDSERSDAEYVNLMFEAIVMVQDIYANGTADQVSVAVGVTRGQSNHPNDPERCLLDDEHTRRLASAIENLPEPERTILDLHYLQEKSITEIALGLELSRPWVSKLHMRALRLVRAAMAD